MFQEHTRKFFLYLLYSLDSTTLSCATDDICSGARGGGVSNNWKGYKSRIDQRLGYETDSNLGTKRQGAERLDTLSISQINFDSFFILTHKNLIIVKLLNVMQ